MPNQMFCITLIVVFIVMNFLRHYHIYFRESIEFKPLSKLVRGRELPRLGVPQYVNGSATNTVFIECNSWPLIRNSALFTKFNTLWQVIFLQCILIFHIYPSTKLLNFFITDIFWDFNKSIIFEAVFPSP